MENKNQLEDVGAGSFTHGFFYKRPEHEPREKKEEGTYSPFYRLHDGGGG